MKTILSASDLAHALGGNLQGGYFRLESGNLWLAICPSHRDANRYLSIKAGPGGTINLKCNGSCNRYELLDALASLKLKLDPKLVVHDWLLLWNDSKAIDENALPVLPFLERHGVDIDRRNFRALRYLEPHSRIDDGTRSWLPGLICRVSDVHSRIIGLHRIYMTRNGRKYKELSFGTIKGGAIHLGKASDVLNLAVGVEAGLAIFHCTRRATWAVAGDWNWSALEVPDHVRQVHIWGNHRERKQNMYWYALAERLHRVGKKVFLHFHPMSPGARNKSLTWAHVFRDGQAKLICKTFKKPTADLFVLRHNAEIKVMQLPQEPAPHFMSYD